MRSLLPARAYRTFRAAAVLLLALSACSPGATPVPEISGRAALILVGPDHTSRTTCVDFLGDEIRGRDLLESAGIAMTLDERNAMGALVCAVEGYGCDYPADSCLCRCEGLGDCSYWASFVRTPPGAWTYAGQGVSTQRLRAGDLYAWVWLPTASSAAALDWLPSGELDSVCP